MTESLWTQPPQASTQRSNLLCPVPADELGFALSIFVAAANRTFTASRRDGANLPEETLECERLFGDLLVHGPAMDPRRVLPCQASLHSAFAALWREYRAHEFRDSICARVLCFYFLMERTGGAVVQRWTRPCPERPEEVLLLPAVVAGLARVPLDRKAGLLEPELLAAINICGAVSLAV